MPHETDPKKGLETQKQLVKLKHSDNLIYIFLSLLKQYDQALPHMMHGPNSPPTDLQTGLHLKNRVGKFKNGDASGFFCYNLTIHT